MGTPVILCTSEFRIPFLEYRGSRLEEIIRKMEKYPRKKLFELGIFENEKYGQVSSTPLGIKIVQQIKKQLRGISAKYGFSEYGYVPLLDSELLIKSGRSEKFCSDIMRIENSSAILHPTAEEWFLYLFQNRKIRISKAKDYISLYHFTIFFRDIKRGKKPLRLKVFNLYSGYLISYRSDDLVKEQLENFFLEVWETFNLKNYIVKSISDKEYIDYFIVSNEGDDFYYLKDKLIFPNEINNFDKKIRGVSIGMFAEFPDLPKKFGLGEYKIYAYALGIERLIYAFYYTKSPVLKFVDLYVIPLFKLQNKNDYREIIQKATKERPEANLIVVDDSKAPVQIKKKYASLIGSKEIIKIGRYEIEAIR